MYKARRKPSVSACVPALNEAGNIERLVRELDRVLEELAAEHEIIVVDDGSSDGTATVLERLSAEVPRLRIITHPENLGYGRSLRDAFAAARHDYIFYTDGDGQFDVAELPRFLARSGPNRAVVGYRTKRSEGAGRALTSLAYNLLVRILFGLKLRDVDCSFKVFPTTLVKSLVLRSDKFFIDTELMTKLAAAGATIEELAVSHKPRTAGRSTVSAKHVITTVREIIELWPDLKGKR